MSKPIKSRNKTMLFYLVLVLSIYGVSKGGDVVLGKLTSLSVKRLETVASHTKAIDTKSFYPVWVKVPAAIKADEEAAGNVDDLFKKPTDAKPVEVVKPPEFDYVGNYKNSIKLDALSDNGAVINGKFYEIGAKLLDFPLGEGSNAAIPVLSAIKGQAITIVVGKKSFDIVLKNI